MALLFTNYGQISKTFLSFFSPLPNPPHRLVGGGKKNLLYPLNNYFFEFK